MRRSRCMGSASTAEESMFGKRCVLGSASLALVLVPLASNAELPVIPPRAETPVLHRYDDAPRTPDSDDPAIWVHPSRPERGLVIGVLKEAGLQVYDLNGRVVQTVLPPNRPALSAQDPIAPGPQPEAGTSACPESEDGETFGRFNNVDIQYGFPLRGTDGRVRKVDLAVVTDRGCDRLRIYAIEPGRAGGPLFDVTARTAARVFPERYVQPSPFQPTGEVVGLQPNPLDDQSTAYGLGLYRDPSDRFHAFVTQRSRSVVAWLELYEAGTEQVGYRKVREFRFNPRFSLPTPDGHGQLLWSPCREEPAEDPQLEGLVVDQQEGILYAAQEVVGLWKVPLTVSLPRVVDVPPSRLIDPVKSFGAPYWAVPDEDEYSCELEAPAPLPEGTIAVPGNPSVGGKHLEADVEGLALYYTEDKEGYLLVSSQGDDTLHIYDREGGWTRERGNRHLGSFRVEGVGETDGHDVVNVPMGANFPRGLVVLQTGKASPPANTDPVNGYEYDGSTQFKLVRWDDIAEAVPPGFKVETKEYDPRDPHDD
ncbi:phytase [Archangium violaceum]|nr:phytase [Archangium violaceum]